MPSILQALQSAQFVVDARGERVAVQLSPVVWQALLNWIADVEQVPSVEELTQTGEVHEAEPNLIDAAAQLAEPAFARAWDNPEDDIYNDL